MRNQMQYPDIITICVDAYEQNEMKGRLYCQSRPEELMPFSSLMDFLVGVDRIQNRSGETPALQPTEENPFPYRPSGTLNRTDAYGRLTTFSLQILQRENGSWQGTFFGFRNRVPLAFRSELELLMLMDGALKAAAMGREDCFTEAV